MTDDLTLSDWLDSTAEKRADLLAYSKSQISTDPGQRQLDLSVAIERSEDAGELEADSESYLIQAEAQAVLEVRKKYEDLSADERKTMVKLQTKDVRRLRDGMAVVRRAIQNRIFAIQNIGRSTL